MIIATMLGFDNILCLIVYIISIYVMQFSFDGTDKPCLILVRFVVSWLVVIVLNQHIPPWCQQFLRNKTEYVFQSLTPSDAVTVTIPKTWCKALFMDFQNQHYACGLFY